ncbi:MAG: glycosyltransferase family 4 protein [Candidatus Woesearchaeota archaeon]
MRPKVLMFGWEFPPFNSGGLGTACHGLTKYLAKYADVTFVLPTLSEGAKADFVKLVGADESMSKVKIKEIRSPMVGYMTPEEYDKEITEMKKSGKKVSLYGKNLFFEVERYAKAAGEIARREKFDVIHAHDWLTYGAGIHAKKVSGKPLVVHVHATEYDRTGGNGVNQFVYDREKAGMTYADKVITVSNYTKQMVIKHYGIPAEKIEVVHNAVEFPDYKVKDDKTMEKVVLFLGRITLQKGPDYFVYAAHRALQIDPSIKFVVAGSGDMERFMIEKAVELGIADKMMFTGFLRGKHLDRMYKMADLYVMPSVSEPFGITPLEAARNGTPVIISKQSGVSEIFKNAMKVDFWDIDDMANKIVATLRYNALHQEIKENAAKEVSKISWDIPAQKCFNIYKSVIGGVA